MIWWWWWLFGNCDVIFNGFTSSYVEVTFCSKWFKRVSIADMRLFRSVIWRKTGRVREATIRRWRQDIIKKQMVGFQKRRKLIVLRNKNGNTQVSTHVWLVVWCTVYLIVCMILLKSYSACNSMSYDINFILNKSKVKLAQKCVFQIQMAFNLLRSW